MINQNEEEEEPQNEAREGEKCSIIHSDPSCLSAVTRAIREML